MEEPTNTATLPESVPAAEPAGSQVAAPIPQGTEPVQPGTGVQVEPPVNQSASSPNGTRAKASDYYRQRQEIQNLKRMVNDLTRRLEPSAKPTVPETPPQKVDYSKKVWDDPVSVIDEMLKERLDSRFNQYETSKQAKAQKQEALELIFKNEEVSSAGDEGYDRIIKIMQERKLDKLAQSDPVEAAQTALDIYARKYPKPTPPPKVATPLAPKPGQMGSTQSGNVQASSTPKEASVDDIHTELRKLKEEVIANPDKNFDPEFKKRLEDARKKLTSLIQTK